MQILIAEDEPISRKTLQRSLERWGHQVLPTEDGLAAWKVFEKNDLRMVIADWMMPGLDGIDLTRRIRASKRQGYIYIILLTAKTGRGDLVEGFEAGVDDYIKKPFNPEELEVRLRAGERIITLETNLEEQIRELEAALSRVKQLESLLPVCCMCGEIRDDEGVDRGQGPWQRLEEYLIKRHGVDFSHTFCPKCLPLYKKKQGLS